MLIIVYTASEDLQDDSSEEDSQSDVAMSRPGGIQRKPIGIKKAGTNSQQKGTFLGRYYVWYVISVCNIVVTCVDT